MKSILLILLTFCSNLVFGQCNCETNIISGIKTKQCIPSLVAYDNTYQVGASINSTKEDILLILTVRFKGSAKTIGSDLLIFVNDEKTLSLELLDSQKDYVGGSEICHAKFKLNESNIDFLKNRKLSFLRFHFSNEDIYRTFEVKRNEDVLKNHLNCII